MENVKGGARVMAGKAVSAALALSMAAFACGAAPAWADDAADTGSGSTMSAMGVGATGSSAVIKYSDILAASKEGKSYTFNFDVFSSAYQNADGQTIVESDNGDLVVAPGTQGSDKIELINDTNTAFNYVATPFVSNKNSEVSSAEQQVILDRLNLKVELVDANGNVVSTQTASKMRTGDTAENARIASVLSQTTGSTVKSSQVASGDSTVGSAAADGKYYFRATWDWDFESGGDDAAIAAGNLTDTTLGNQIINSSNVQLELLNLDIGVNLEVTDAARNPDGSIITEPEASTTPDVITPSGTTNPLTPSTYTTASESTTAEAGALSTTGDKMIAYALAGIAAAAGVVLIAAAIGKRKRQKQD